VRGQSSDAGRDSARQASFLLFGRLGSTARAFSTTLAIGGEVSVFGLRVQACRDAPRSQGAFAVRRARVEAATQQ